jgi:glycerophosphoryl diester phosphodiesterase
MTPPFPRTSLSPLPGAPRLDRGVFLRPIAHRGLHRRRRGPLENSAPAFEAAMAKGYGIELDLQAARDGTPMVFHDERLDRLVAASGRIGAYSPAQLARLAYRRQGTAILTFPDCLRLVAGRVPLLVEVKRNRQPPPRAFLQQIADAAARYGGPIGLMSFDRDIVTDLRQLVSQPTGWVVGRHQLAPRWWAAPRTSRKDQAVARLIGSAPAGVAFLAVDVRILRATRAFLVEDGLDLPLFTWTIRTARERAAATRWADAAIFEGYEA